MTKNIDSKLGFGPMSPQIITGIIKASAKLNEPFMLICTQNQIDYDRGYVNNWNTKEYVNYVDKVKNKYKGSKIFLCRDHCGPGFKSNEIDDVYKTIDNDMENGFDMIHIDFSNLGTKKNIMKETEKIIKYIIKKNKNIKIEIGTEENLGEFKNKISEVRNDLDLVKKYILPEFFVVQTGSLVREINQIGGFNKKFIEEVHKILAENRVKLKEHNADYLNYKMIKKRKGIVDAMNIAPQLGVIQTEIVITEALLYGINILPFLEKSYKSKAWKKWLYNNDYKNKMLCSIIAGHYNFTSNEYKDLEYKLQKHIDIEEKITNKIVELVEFYTNNFL